MKKSIFWLFGILQSLSLVFILLLVFRSLNQIPGVAPIGLDTQIILSITFPLFLLLTQYVIHTKKS